MGELLGVEIQRSPHYRHLKLLHCVDYRGMDAELVKRIPLMVLEALRPDVQVNAEEMARMILREGKDFIQAEDF